MNNIALISVCLILFVPRQTGSQEPSDLFWVSSECTDRKGKPQMCYPTFTSVIADRKVNATNTCGEKARQKYCIHMSTSGMATRCQHCDSRNPFESHFPEYMTDKNPNNWWQSETMSDNQLLHFKESANLTVDFGTQFHVNYVYLQFRSPRPHAMIIHKRFDDQSDWVPWAYFSSNCYTYFGMTYSMVPVFTRPDEAICQEEYSTLQPLYDGDVIFSVINGRPNYDRFFEDTELQRWSTAKQIRIELKKMHTFGDERGAEKDTLLTYYFAIQKFTVGGRCLCHGHGNECRPSYGPGQPDRLVCVCAPSHHTTGDNCEQCSPDHRDAPWQPATPQNANPCRACKCNGNANLCEFDAQLYDKTGSGSRCIGCGNNTEGTNCERCKTGFFPDSVYPTVCKPCSCDPIGTVDNQDDCAVTGQCKCKPGVGGPRCDRCLEDYYGFSAGGCQPCNCNPVGGLDNRASCDAQTGQCLCKQNVAGRQCDKCKLGHYGLISNDPLGCKPCNCTLHSSECELDMEQLAVAAGKPGQVVQLNSVVDPDKIIINCPPGQQPCYACLHKDRQHIRVECNGTSEGFLPCLCQPDPNQCQYCPTGWRTPQKDPRSEICTCPAQYTGKSCEQCAPGHRRDPPSGLITDRCATCTCNNHSLACHPETGQCECEDNTAGLFCDHCADGYYGSALVPAGSLEACKPCPCPTGAKCEEIQLPSYKNEVVCKDCPDNRAGTRCERCAENYYGDPVNGISCKPCDCSNNVDPRDFDNCDKTTGECRKCLFGTTGSHCELCLYGYRRNLKPSNVTSGGSDALVPARGCSPCYCDPIGTLVSYGNRGIGVCNPETGQCPCKPGVGGLRCDKCYAGFFGFHSGQGCKPCDCNSVGAIGESCDDQDGQCKCRPHVYGRQCDKCESGFFNLSSIYGCMDCQCHPYGAKSGQCDKNGQCECQPFARGKKCDRCEENHYNLNVGCLPCPACYNLVQARVAKLWGMLGAVFGPFQPDPKPGSQLAPDDKDLHLEMKKLNETIVALYREVLHIGATTSVINQDQLAKTIEAIARQVERVNMDIDEMRKQAPQCPSTDLDEDLNKLYKDIEDRLPAILDGEVRSVLEQLKKSAESHPTDPVLGKEASEVSALANRLATQGEQVQRTAEKIGRLTSNATKKLSDAEVAVKESKALAAVTKQRSDSITGKNKEIAKQIEAVNEHLQKTNNQVYLVRTGTDQVPNLRNEVRLLEGVMARWEGAKNISISLQKRLNESSAEIQNTLDRLRQMNTQLRESLGHSHQQIKLVEPQFQLLKIMLDRVVHAQNISSRAITEAQSKFDQLSDFEDHVAATKTLVPQVMKGVDALRNHLQQIESSVKDLQNQARQELDAANRLKNRTAELGDAMNELQKLLTKTVEQIEPDKDRLRDMKTRNDVEIVHEVSAATQAVESASPDAKQLIETVSTTQAEVKRMSEEAADALRRMKMLKDQLTESVGGGSSAPINGEDAATRFLRLQAELEKLRLPDRLDHLRRLNDARTIEIDYLSKELDEFKAHYNHLQMVNTLLPLRDLNCFYTGKEIEGDVLPVRG